MPPLNTAHSVEADSRRSCVTAPTSQGAGGEALTLNPNGKSAHYSRTKQLLADGLLRVDQQTKKLLLVPDVDLDAVARKYGTADRPWLRAERHEAERVERLQQQLNRVWSNAGGFGPCPVRAIGRNTAHCSISGDELDPDDAYRRADTLAKRQRKEHDTWAAVSPATADVVVMDDDQRQVVATHTPLAAAADEIDSEIGDHEEPSRWVA